MAVASSAVRQGRHLAGFIGERAPSSLDLVGQLAQAAAARQSTMEPPGHRNPADNSGFLTNLAVVGVGVDNRQKARLGVHDHISLGAVHYTDATR